MKKKGISLVVLIITIIVMIIIAGAVILTLTQTNIIDQAEIAVNKSNEMELKQRINLVFTEAQTNKYIGVEYSVEDNLKVIFEEMYGKDNVTVTQSGSNYKVKLKDSNEVLKVKQDGTIEEYKEMAPTEVYARLDDEGMLYLRATKIDDRYKEYVNTYSIQADWNTVGNADNMSVVKVIIEEEIAPTTMYAMFWNYRNLKEIENIHNLHTENVTTMASAFNWCSSLVELDVAGFDTSKVTNFADMFIDCKSLNKLDVNNFDTSNAVRMDGMFSGCESLKNIDVSGFNTNKVSSFVSMFFKCKSLETIDISGLDTTNISTFRNMFAYCEKLKSIDLSNFDTQNNTSLYATFFQCNNLKTIKLGKEFIINEGVDLQYALDSVPSDIKITAIESTRDKLIEASTLTEANFEIIK